MKLTLERNKNVPRQRSASGSTTLKFLRNLERSGIFFRLNGHHLLHHRYMHKNFNVVFPLADLCFGTLLVRSKVQFKQAEGPSVPNVQPREAKVSKKTPALVSN